MILDDIQEYDKNYFKREYDQLREHFNEEVYKELQSQGIMLCGGAITSLFTNTEINDFDLYFRTYESFESTYINLSSFSSSEFGDFKNQYCINESDVFEDFRFILKTSKSLTYTSFSGHQYQFIYYNFYKNPIEIFEDFDFTINMGCFDFKREKWVFHKDFLKHLSQRVLEFNPHTKFPIISLLRFYKYQQRGYSFSKKELFKLSASIANLNLDSWDNVRKHFSGMYGEKIFDIFNDDTLKCDHENIIVLLEKVVFDKDKERNEIIDSKYRSKDFFQFLVDLKSFKNKYYGTPEYVECYFNLTYYNNWCSHDKKLNFNLIPQSDNEFTITSILEVTDNYLCTEKIDPKKEYFKVKILESFHESDSFTRTDKFKVEVLNIE